MTWPATDPAAAVHVDSFARAGESLRRLQDVFAAARPDGAAFDELAATLEAARQRLEPLVGEESGQMLGRVRELPVRGHAMVPEFVATTHEPGLVAGIVTFGRWFMGGGMAAHGGAIALVFDEVFGPLVVGAVRQRIRTAYLKVDYRAITPIDTELQMTVRVDRVEGRKVFALGQLWNGDILCAEADALFLTLLPGQQ